MTSLSKDAVVEYLRSRNYLQSQTCEAVARQFGCHPSTANRWLKRWVADGTLRVKDLGWGFWYKPAYIVVEKDVDNEIHD